ncbi:MAG: hypothetical protein WCF64_11820 [Methylocella sp.]
MRLRTMYYRFVDGPSWASKILETGSLQFLPANEANELMEIGAAEPHR